MKFRFRAEVKSLDDVMSAGPYSSAAQSRAAAALCRDVLNTSGKVCEALNRESFGQEIEAQNADEAELVAVGAYVLAARCRPGISPLLTARKPLKRLVRSTGLYLDLVKIGVSPCDAGGKISGKG